MATSRDFWDEKTFFLLAMEIFKLKLTLRKFIYWKIWIIFDRKQARRQDCKEFIWKSQEDKLHHEEKKSTYKFIFLCNSWKLERSNKKKSLSILDANEHCEFSRRLSGKAKSTMWKICSKQLVIQVEGEEQSKDGKKELNKMRKNCYANLIANYRSFCAAAA